MPFNRHIALFFLCMTCTPAMLRSQDDIIRKADALRAEYRFQEAADLYRRAAEASSDSTVIYSIEKSIMLCDNGTSFLKYISVPTTKASRNVPVREVPYWLPEMRGGWSPIPNPIDSVSCKYQNHTFFPEGSDRIIYAGPAADGKWDIFEVKREAGTQWSAPVPLSELNSSGNEIFPILSTDGRRLWFASDGHPGIGGYDVFVSLWDESQKKWGAPENVGFPYSSTSDDFLYFDTPDGNWSVLVSDRDASAGTATIYIMELESNPIKTSVSDASEIRKIARLEAAENTAASSQPSAKAKEDAPADSYTAAVLEMRRCQKNYQQILDELDRSRTEYDQADGQSRITGLAQKISGLEIESGQAKDKLDASSLAVRKAEMELLKKGVIPPAVEEEQAAPDAGTGSPDYKFAKKDPITAPDMTVRIPEPVFDYTFRIQQETEIAPEEPLPDGIVYQVQMMSLGSKPAASRFKGVTPAFIRRNSSGNYVCCGGLFRKYDDAYKALAKIKAKGFTQAFLVAFKDGKSIQVKTARLQEKATDGSSYNVTLSGYPDGLPSVVKTAISTSCTKDLAKSTVDGSVVYIIGPFTQKSEAESLVSALEAVGAEGVSMETVTK